MKCCGCQEAEATIFRKCRHNFCEACDEVIGPKCRDKICKTTACYPRSGLPSSEMIAIREAHQTKIEAEELRTLEAISDYEKSRKESLDELIANFNKETEMTVKFMIDNYQDEQKQNDKISKRMDAEIDFTEMLERDPELRDIYIPGETHRVVRLGPDSELLRDPNPIYLSLKLHWSCGFRLCEVFTSKGAFTFKILHGETNPTISELKFESGRPVPQDEYSHYRDIKAVIAVSDNSMLVGFSIPEYDHSRSPPLFVIVELNYETKSATLSYRKMEGGARSVPALAQREVCPAGYFRNGEIRRVFPGVFYAKVEAQDQSTLIYWILESPSYEVDYNFVATEVTHPDPNYCRVKLLKNKLVQPDTYLLLPRI